MRFPLLSNGFDQCIFAPIAHDKVDSWKGGNRFGVHLGVATCDDEQGLRMATMRLGDKLTGTTIA
jgi:hypothetical protein